MTRMVSTLLACLVLVAAAAVEAAAPAPPLLVATVFVEEMTPEMRAAFVRGIQEELAAHGYAPGPADAIQGPQTREAIRRYQRDAGLTVDGRASKELLDHLKFALPRVTARPEPQPDPLVLDLQGRLSDLGYYRGALDGLIGPETREAVRAFRTDAGLPVSGAVDTELILALEAAAPHGESLGEALPPPAEDAPHWTESAGEGAEAPLSGDGSQPGE